MKILIVSLYFYPDNTGIPKYTSEMAEWLARRGHEVSVLTGVPHYPSWRREPKTDRWFSFSKWRGVDLLRIPHFVPDDGRITTFRRQLIDATFLASGLAGILLLFLRDRKKADLTIAVCPSMFCGLLAHLNKTLTGAPWIFHIQDFQVDAAARLRLMNNSSLVKALYQLEGWLLKSANKVASITPAMCDRAVQKGSSAANVILLENWSDIDSITPSDRDNEFRSAWGIGPDVTIVMYAGAMGAKQGLNLVLDAAAKMAQRKDIFFVMVGSGPEAQKLQQLAKDRGLANMLFMPLQPTAKLNAMLGAADIHLVVQKAEAADIVMPSKLANIFAAGRPAVATATPGTALFEAMQTSRGGLAIEPECVDALHKAILALADNPAQREMMGRNARDFAVASLARDSLLGRFEAQLLALAGAAA